VGVLGFLDFRSLGIDWRVSSLSSLAFVGEGSRMASIHSYLWFAVPIRQLSVLHAIFIPLWNDDVIKEAQMNGQQPIR